MTLIIATQELVHSCLIEHIIIYKGRSGILVDGAIHSHALFPVKFIDLFEEFLTIFLLTCTIYTRTILGRFGISRSRIGRTFGSLSRIFEWLVFDQLN